MAQDGTAQVGQAGHFNRGPPEPDMAVPGSATRGKGLVTGVTVAAGSRPEH